MPKNCKNCGAEMPEEAHFCLSCLTETEEKAVITANKTSFFADKKRTIALIATALLIIALILICIFCFGNKNHSPANNEENKAVVSTVTQDDGSVVTEYDDGSIETLEPDGTKITQETDGTVKTETPDGKTVTEKPDGTTITETPDGTTVTEKPDGTVITEKPDSTTEITEKPTEPPTEKPTEPNTNKPSTEKPTEPTTENTTDKTEDTPAINYNDFTFEYKKYGNKDELCITKYTGNAKVVTVPYSYNDEYIYEICTNAFNGNSNVEKIIFNAPDDYAMGIACAAIYNCPNLKEVVFNWNEYYKTIYYNSQYGNTTIANLFAEKCPNLTNIRISGTRYYKVFENGVYRNSYLNNDNRWSLIYCWGNKWTQPSWCETVVYCIFHETPSIKTIYINPYDGNFANYRSDWLEHIYILEGNAYYYNDENGNVVHKASGKIERTTKY